MIVYNTWKKGGTDRLKDNTLSILKNWVFYCFVLAAATRSITNLYASRFTSAIYVQLLTLSVPFIVSFLSYCFLKEKVTKSTIICMCATIVGGVLLILAGAKKDEKYTFYWLIDFKNLGQNLTYLDIIGIGIALLSSVLLSLYMILIRYTERSGRKKLSSETLLLGQMSSGIFFLILSFIFQEDWIAYARMSVLDWFVFYTFAIVVFLLANVTNIYAIAKLGAPTASSILALRLVSTLIVSWPMLGEVLNNFWQIVGAVIVIVSVTLYMWSKRKSNHSSQERPVEDVIREMMVDDEIPEIQNQQEAPTDTVIHSEMENVL